MEKQNPNEFIRDSIATVLLTYFSPQIVNELLDTAHLEFNRMAKKYEKDFSSLTLLTHLLQSSLELQMVQCSFLDFFRVVLMRYIADVQSKKMEISKN